MGQHPPCLRFLPRQSNCVDYMMREFQGKELMRKIQYHLHFYLPMRIIHL